VIETGPGGHVTISFEQYANTLYLHVYDQRGITPHVDWCATTTSKVPCMEPEAERSSIGVGPIDASELSLAAVLGCVRATVRSGYGVLTFPTWSVVIVGSARSASVRTFTWRGLTGMQLGILDVWAEAHRESTVEGGPIPTTSGVIASAVDVALRVLDDPKLLDLPCLANYRAVLVEYAETGSQESVREAVRALLCVGR